jgi:hypothetical protein
MAAGAVVALLLGLASCGRSGSAGSAPRLAQYVGKTLGNAAAPIAVEAILPVNNGCQDALGVYLAQTVSQNPTLFRLRIFDMKSAEGRALMASKGIKCAAVLVQGTTQFDLGAEAGKILLEGPMDPMDLYRVLSFHLKTTAASAVVLPEPSEDCTVPRAEERRKAGF